MDKPLMFIDFKKCIVSFFLLFLGAIRKCSCGALFRLIWRKLSSVPELHLHLHWIAAVFVGCGIIWDYDYMRHWKKKVEMGKTDGWGLVRTCSPGRCPGRVLNGYSMGTNVNTPFFKYPRQNITMSFLTKPLKSASSSGASFFAQRRARNPCDWWRRARPVFSSRLQFLCAHEEALKS